LVPLGWGFRFRRKVMLSTFAAVCFGMVLAAVGFVAVDVSATRALIRDNLRGQAESLARNLSPALGFDDAPAALEDLEDLCDGTHIIRAVVYKIYSNDESEPNEVAFAQYHKDKVNTNFPKIKHNSDDFWGEKSAWAIRPITQNGIDIGSIYLERTLSDVDNRFKRYAGMAFGVAGIGVFVTMIGALWFQSSLTRPILELSSTAYKVASSKDFSVRAQKHSEDELGDLTDIFNDMLATVDEANRILRQSNAEMEDNVKARTHLLTLANQNLVEEAKERERAEEKLLDANRRLNVQERLVAVGQVSANIAHELRNPHSAIRQSVYFLNKMVENRFRLGQHPKEEKIREHLDLIVAELSRSDEVINGLLGMSKGEKLNMVAFDLIPLVKEVAKYCRLRDDISIVHDFAESPFLIFADSALFRQVFINLFTNAEQAMPDGGTITVTCGHSPNAETVIVVSDTGLGINDDDLMKVFDALHTTKAGGAGIGLSLCRDILQRHEGSIAIGDASQKYTWLKSKWKQDKGAKIVMILPRKFYEAKNNTKPNEQG